MKYLLIIFFLQCPFLFLAQNSFKQYFVEHALRIDFILAGDKNSEEIYLQQMKRENNWAGPVTLKAPFDYGNYRVLVKSLSGKTLYRKGFSSLFEEYQTTRLAEKRKRSFCQTIRIPYPKDTVEVYFQKRDYDTGEFITLLQRKVDPKNYFILEEKPPGVGYEMVVNSGEPAESVDIAFLSEGYTHEEMDKFIQDVQRMTNYIFNQKPFAQYRDRFNVYAVKCISEESGPDNPGEDIYRRTALNFSYYTFDIPRYLTSEDTRSIRDYAAAVPYDHIVILINTKQYGGGGFYNHYTATTTNHAYSKEVAIHELGHGFAGLGDEYYTSDVAYSEFYNTETEPWEPNITTLVDFDEKWKSMVKESTPIPTPRKKEYRKAVGVFEGGGYVSKGVFSPYMDCRMKSNTAEGFCPVCQKAIEEMIKYYLGEDK